MRFLRMSPVVALLLLLPILGGSVALERMIAARRTELIEARRDYAIALAETKSELSAQVARAANDGTLAQNLNWHLKHSVLSSLDGKLQAGALDALAVFGPACADLGQTQIANKGLAAPCPPPLGRDGAFWQTNAKDPPVLGAAAPLTGVEGGGVQMVGLLRLDGQWLGVHDALRDRLHTLGLHIGTADEMAKGGMVTIMDAGVEVGGTSMTPLVPPAPLLSDRMVDRLTFSRMGRVFAVGNPVLWPSMIAAYLCVLLALGQERARRLRDTSVLRGFLNWCGALISGKPALPKAHALAAQVTGEIEGDLAIARQELDKAWLGKSEAIQRLTTKQFELAGRLALREDELRRQRQRLTELAELDSLAMQLQRTTATFLQRMDTLHGKADELHSVLGAAVATEALALRKAAQDWRQGIDERGSRKFIRGLAETPSTSHPERTLLDDEIATILARTQKLHDFVAGARNGLRELVAEAAFAAKIAGFWHALAQKTHAESVCQNLQTPIAAAQQLVHLEAGFSSLTFANASLDLAADQLPEVPEAIWVASLYHIYLAMAELAWNNKASIATRWREDGGRSMLVVQVAASDGEKLPQRSDQQGYHLEVSRSILAPFDITVAALPALDGPFPVALSWQAASPYRRRSVPLPTATAAIVGPETEAQMS